MDYSSGDEERFYESLVRTEEGRETDQDDGIDTEIGGLPVGETGPTAVVREVPVIVIDSDEDDPEEIPEADPLDAPVDPIPAADPIEEDPIEEDPIEEDPAEDYPSEDEELEWGVLPVTPPGSPASVEESDEIIPEDTDMEIATDGEIEIPPPPPIPVISAEEHHWVVSRLISDLNASEARVYELERQLAAERLLRRHTRQATRRSVLRGVRADVRRIERRAFSRLRSVARAQGKRIRLRDTERVVERYMLRVREMTRAYDD